MKGRNAQVTRIYKILTLLEGAPHGLSVMDICDRLAQRGFEVGKRTVYRDLDALRAAGFPLDEKGKSEDNGTRWTLERNTKVSNYLVLSVRELIALYLVRSILAPLKETPFFEDLQTTFNKIEEKIGQRGQAFLDELSGGFHFEPGPRWGLGLDPDTVETVRVACMEKHFLSVTYSSASSQTVSERVLGPHFLYFAKGSLYLVAEDMGDNKVKIFSVPRMQNAHMKDEEYTQPSVDADKFFGSSFGVYHSEDQSHVKLRFHPKLAPYIRERQWHSSQRLVSKEAGFVEMSLDVALTPDLVQWVLGFGPNVEVVEPQELAQQIREEAMRTFELYSKKAG